MCSLGVRKILAKASVITSSKGVVELKQDYGQLQIHFGKEGSQAVPEFVRGPSSAYLDEFIEANTLPIPTKASKEAVEEALAVWHKEGS
jgi:hypothetical protein